MKLSEPEFVEFVNFLNNIAKLAEYLKANTHNTVDSVKTNYLHDELMQLLTAADEQFKNYTLASSSHLNFAPVTASDSVFAKLTGKYRGKVIYVDFWGPWCSPCMAAMPSVKVLFENYKGKDVVFLFLAVSTQEAIWKSSIGNNKIPGEHYMLKGSQEKALAAKFNISGYPHYLLVDRLGYVKDTNAGHPDDKALKRAIDEMLLQK